jgi:hypothetical protein
MKLLLHHSKQFQELHFKVVVIGTMTQLPGKVLAFVFIDILLCRIEYTSYCSGCIFFENFWKQNLDTTFM